MRKSVCVKVTAKTIPGLLHEYWYFVLETH